MEFERDARLKEQWAIEHFPDSLPPKALDRIKFIKPLAERGGIRSMTFTCTRPAPRNDRVPCGRQDSFAYWQLSKTEWLPSKPSLVHKDNWISPLNGYLPGKGLGRMVRDKLNEPSASPEPVKPPLPNHPKDGKTIHPTGNDGDTKPHTKKVETGVTRQSHGSTQIRKDKGKDAEDWFRNELKKLLGLHGWRISERPERDEDNLESDIVLTHDQKGTYHIEVKHAEADTLYWSIKEVEKARKNPKRYWMVIIRPTEEGQTGYRSILIEDPLETLKHNERSGTWLWQGRDDNVPVNEGGYLPEPKPIKEANNFSFRININDSCFNWNKFPNAFDFIKDKLIET